MSLSETVYTAFPPAARERERDRHREIMHRIIQPHTSVVWRNLPQNSPRSKRESSNSKTLFYKDCSSGSIRKT